MNNMLQETRPLSDFAQPKTRRGLWHFSGSNESFIEQDSESSALPSLATDRNRTFVKPNSLGVQFGMVVLQPVIPKVLFDLGEARKGPSGFSSFIGNRIPLREYPAPSRMLTLESLLAPASQLEKRGHLDAALDVLYDRVDGLLQTKEFGTLDAILAQADADRLSTDIIIGLLTATLPAKSKLPSRTHFFADSESSIRSRGDWEAGLLAGLEP